MNHWHFCSVVYITQHFTKKVWQARAHGDADGGSHLIAVATRYVWGVRSPVGGNGRRQLGSTGGLM